MAVNLFRYYIQQENIWQYNTYKVSKHIIEFSGYISKNKDGKILTIVNEVNNYQNNIK